jgi:Lrp/AsnC family transcriptional regulator for asnA, asnC and gidA
MPVMLTAFERDVIKLLQDDGRLSSEQLAKRLNVHPTTVRRTIRRLTESGVILIQASVNAEKAGEPLAALLGLNVDPIKLENIVSSLASYPEVKLVSAAAGRYDIIVYGRFQSNDNLLNFIQTKVARLTGLRGTETFILFHVKKNETTRIY